MAQAFFTIILFVSVILYFVPNLMEAGWGPNSIALLVVSIVVAYALARALRWSLARAVLRVGIPIGALLTFAVIHGQGNPTNERALIGGVLLIAVVLYGIYIMVFGAFRKKSKGQRERED